MRDLNILADNDEGEVESFPRQATGDVVQCSCELRGKLLCIKKRRSRFEGRRDASFGDGRHDGEYGVKIGEEDSLILKQENKNSIRDETRYSYVIERLVTTRYFED